MSARAQTLTQLARAVGLQRRFEEAHAILDEAAALLDQAGPLAAGPLAEIRYRLERGRLHNSSGEKAPARGCFQQAWEAARAAGEDGFAVDAEAVDTAHMLAIAAATPAETIRWNERALALAGASDDERAQRWQASLLNNLGWARHDGGEYEAALALFERALAERQKRRQHRETRVARWCVARCLRSLGRVDEALAQQRALLAEGKRPAKRSVSRWKKSASACWRSAGERNRAPISRGPTKRSPRMPGSPPRRAIGWRG